MTSPVLSFYGDPALKAVVLKQLDDQAARARSAPVVVGGHTIMLCIMGRTRDLAAAAALGIPEAVLDVGFSLYDGFPETADDTREFIRTRRKLIDAIPVGVDFADFAGYYCRGLLDDPALEFRRLVHSPDVGRLRYEICEALEVDPRGGFLDGDLQRRVNSRLGDILGVIPYQHQTSGLVDPAVRKTHQALEILEAVCRLPRDPFATGDAADLLLNALFADVDAEHTFEIGIERQNRLFVRLLATTADGLGRRRGR